MAAVGFMRAPADPGATQPGQPGGSGSRWLLFLALGLVGLLGLLLLASLGGVALWRGQQARAQQAAIQAPPATGTTALTIRDLAYRAPHIQVPAGTSVTWTNQDGARHDVRFRNGKGGSQLLASGQTFRTEFATPGVYEYFCSDHPFMAGKVTVTP